MGDPAIEAAMKDMEFVRHDYLAVALRPIYEELVCLNMALAANGLIAPEELERCRVQAKHVTEQGIKALFDQRRAEEPELAEEWNAVEKIITGA